MLNLLSVSRLRLAHAVGLSLVAGLCNTALLYLLSHAQDGHSPYVAVGLFSLALVGFFVSQRWLLHSIARQSEHVLRQLRVDLARRVLRTRYAELEEVGRAELLSALTHDATVLSQFWPLLVNLLLAAATIVFSLIYLGLLAPLAFGITVAALLTGIALVLFIGRRSRALLESARTRQDLFLAIVDDLLDGVKELKISQGRRHDLYRRELTETTDLYLDESTRAKLASHDAALAGQGVFFILAGLVAFMLPHAQIIDTEARFAFLLVLLYLMGPLTRITGNLPLINNARVSARRILKLRERLAAAVELNCDADQAPTRSCFSADWQRLHLADARYVYADQTGRSFSLGPLNLDIRRGECLFVVGGNGSGKSTLGKVLTGLYLPTGGVIRVGDIEVTAHNQDEYRQLFSVVFSDFHLFERLTGLTAKARARAPELLVDLGLPVDLLASPDSARFSALSKGQQRRLALILAYLEERSIFFFDEWAADQDPVYRERFYRDILPSLQVAGRTVVAVTHDDRFFHLADRVIELDKGRIVNSDQDGGPGCAGTPALRLRAENNGEAA